MEKINYKTNTIGNIREINIVDFRRHLVAPINVISRQIAVLGQKKIVSETNIA